MAKDIVRTYRCDDVLHAAALARAREVDGRSLSAAIRWLLAEWLAIDDQLYLAALRKAKVEGTTLGAVVRGLLADWVTPHGIRNHPGRRRTDSGPRALGAGGAPPRSVAPTAAPTTAASRSAKVGP